MKSIFIIIAVVAGTLFLTAAGFYAVLPAHNLPTFLPGYEAALTRHHYTHAVASLGLGLVCFAYAWFASGKKSSSK